MRSSIACARCRRSKVKCVNNGVNTTCRACETTGRECTYPPPAVPGAGGAVRREAIIVAGNNPPVEGASAATGETPRRHRVKKSGISAPAHPAPSKESPRALVDALDPNILTPKVWTELFDIFQLHFSTDLPFIHPPTFLKPLRQSSLQPPAEYGASNYPSAPTPNASPVLLLAFLALTARFHPQLVAYHSPPTSSRPSNPLVASEYYCAAAKSRLAGNFGDSLGLPDLERTQALLMVGLHEWGMCQGVRAWISVGVAVRSAQVLGLQFEHELDDMPFSRSLALNTEAQHLGVNTRREPAASLSKADAFIEQEIRRRTFWSCFLMDRYLSSGKYRPQMLNVKDLRIQLPSSDRAFLFGEKVRTLLLGEGFDDVAGRAEVQSQRHASVMMASEISEPRRESTSGMSGTPNDMRMKDDEEKGRWEIGADEGILSRFIKILDLYGRIVKWSCAGGRRREQFPPWDERSTFFSLQNAVAAFVTSLPRDLTLTPANISAHIASRTSTPYTIMHAVLSLCRIMLHREYIPFIPLRCAKPQGPLDAPVFPPEEYDIPSGFWEESTRELFRSARSLIDLLRTCQEWGVLVETPIVGFATYTVASVGVYAINFPWMDQDGFMCNSSRNHSDPNNGQGAEAARKALEIVGQMRKRLQMAEGWFRTIKRVHLYYSRIKKDFRRNTRALAASNATESADLPEIHRHLCLREGGGGGGLEEYKLLERTLKEFGSLEDEDLEMPDASDDTNGIGRDGSETGSNAVKSEVMDLGGGTPDSAGIRQERWNAINTVAAAAAQRTESNASPNVNGNSGYPPSSLPALSNVSTPPSQVGQFHPSDRTQQLPIGAGAPLASPTSTGANATGNHYERNMGQAQQQAYGYQPSEPAPQASAWSPEMKEKWLNTLDTRFGGDDIAAFVAGNDWEDWAGMAASTQGTSGWLSAVWRGAPVT